MIPLNISAPGAFIAGILSFFSPCILPLVPSYISYITGSVFSVTEKEEISSDARKLTVFYSLCFILGFSAVFIIMGMAASQLGSLFAEYRDAVRTIGGFLIIVFGLHITGVLKIGLLNSYFRFDANSSASGYFRSFLFGVIFATGWTPCVGPILGSILIIAGTEADLLNGMFLLCLYSLGMAIPFFVISFSANYFLAKLRGINRWIHAINRISGAILVAAGILLATGTFERLSYLFY